MKKIIIILIYMVLNIPGINVIAAIDEGEIKITILYDNYLHTEGCETDWGFACLIEGTERKILFDTGSKDDVLFSNIKKLNVNIKDVELVVISHNHGDHIGGLFKFIQTNQNIQVYLPNSSPNELIKKIEQEKAIVKKESKSVEICKDVFLTGEMGEQIKEQALILNTTRGLIVLTGCAHPGIIQITKNAQELLNKNIHMVFGGFHLMSHTNNQVKEIISEFKNMGVNKIAATHCTGDNAIAMFQKEYKANYVRLGVGKIIKIIY